MKIPCDDERDFYARIADRITANGLRVALDKPRPIGSRVAVALELRNGRILNGEGVIDAHVRLDGMRPGVNVRFVKLDRPPGDPAAARETTRGAPEPVDDPGLPDLPELPDLPHLPEPWPSSAVTDQAGGTDAGIDDPLRSTGEELEQSPFGGSPRPPPAAALEEAPSYTGSAEIFAQVRRRTVRAQRAAAGVAVAALIVAVAGYAVIRLAGTPATPDAAVAAHLEAADRLFAAGRLTGAGGALEHLLVARQLRPADPAIDARLRRAADMLESLGARALDRGDLAVASIHLAAAKLADPGRPSIRQKMDRLDRMRARRSPR